MSKSERRVFFEDGSSIRATTREQFEADCHEMAKLSDDEFRAKAKATGLEVTDEQIAEFRRIWGSR